MNNLEVIKTIKQHTSEIEELKASLEELKNVYFGLNKSSVEKQNKKVKEGI